jgi:hypothetical protein
VSLRTWLHPHVGLAAVTELIALLHNAIRIKCSDFEAPMNSSGHFAP